MSHEYVKHKSNIFECCEKSCTSLKYIFAVFIDVCDDIKVLVKKWIYNPFFEFSACNLIENIFDN